MKKSEGKKKGWEEKGKSERSKGVDLEVKVRDWGEVDGKRVKSELDLLKKYVKRRVDSKNIVFV
ncbi:MAG: hypothetical protein ABH864_06630 [archaeon]